MSSKENGAGLAAMTLGALGVVYGDIGTSPLYTLHEIFVPVSGVGVPLDTHHLIGAISTIFWGLMRVVTLKYVILVLRADNNGEGGAMALTALASKAAVGTPRRRSIILLVGIAGATLFFGNSVITPAVTVLGAVEGIEVATPALEAYGVPLSVATLVVLFAAQRFGTGAFGKAFGPTIVVWFSGLAVTGLMHVVQAPEILQTLNPLNAAGFLIDRGWHVFAALGAIVLALTGAEALYADMGTSARRRSASPGALVLPALHPAGPRAVPQPRAGGRGVLDQLLRQPRDGGAHARRRHGALARTPVRRDDAELGQCDGVFPDPEQRGDRARHARADLIAAPISPCD